MNFIKSESEPKLHAETHQWMPIALAAKAAAGDVRGALASSSSIVDIPTRACGMLKIAIVQSREAQGISAAARTVEAAENPMEQTKSQKDTGLPLAEVETKRWDRTYDEGRLVVG